MHPPERSEVEFNRLLDERRITAVFQPVVELDSGQVVGYEALARGPAGSSLSRPAALFEHAYRVGRADELDWVCRAAAFRGALAASLPQNTRLLVNVEPLSLRTPCPPDLVKVIAAGSRRFCVVLELTERALANDPAAVLPAVQDARREGTGIALDDVGAVPASLAMMPLLQPDLIKLDLSLVQSRSGPVQAQIVNAVLAEAERTGATILAEGIESPAHARTARSMGAELGQGWHYGVAVTDPAAPSRTAPRGVPRFDLDSARHKTPFEIITKSRPAHPASRELLKSMSRRIEYKANDPSEPAVLLACFQHVDKFDEATRQQYGDIATRATMVATLAEGMPVEPVRGVRGTMIRPDDPLRREWVVAVIGPHFAAALVAIEESGLDPEPAHRFSYAITHDRELVIATARPVLHRMRPLTPARPDNDPFWTD
jgi:EAL domain-containing protein (putative c-di-GMP-specific phosphodiesterase class I)